MHTQTIEQEPRLNQPEYEPQMFDLLASVDMARFDLHERGYITHETKQRILDEELTLIVEGVDRPHRTTFVLKDMDGELMYFDEGKWRPYISSMYNGLNVAESLADNDSRYEFQAQRAAQELKESYTMQGLMPGESMVVCRQYP
ncbi:MAG: hypothetical protein AAB459_00695, partial [Patescibacteria group bacterium]